MPLVTSHTAALFKTNVLALVIYHSSIVVYLYPTLRYSYLASFPYLPTLQFLIACSVHISSIVPRPSLPPRHMHTASNQKLDGGKAWERGYIVITFCRQIMTFQCAKNLLSKLFVLIQCREKGRTNCVFSERFWLVQANTFAL